MQKKKKKISSNLNKILFFFFFLRFQAQTTDKRTISRNPHGNTFPPLSLEHYFDSLHWPVVLPWPLLRQDFDGNVYLRKYKRLEILLSYLLGAFYFHIIHFVSWTWALRMVPISPFLLLSSSERERELWTCIFI